MSQYKRIHTAIDSSDQRDRVLAASADFAAATGATVPAAHVDADAPAFDTDNDAERAGAATPVVNDAVAFLRRRGVLADGGVAHGPDGDVYMLVLEAARDLDADLIVVGANHRHGMRALLEPSVA